MRRCYDCGRWMLSPLRKRCRECARTGKTGGNRREMRADHRRSRRWLRKH